MGLFGGNNPQDTPERAASDTALAQATNDLEGSSLGGNIAVSEGALTGADELETGEYEFDLTASKPVLDDTMVPQKYNQVASVNNIVSTKRSDQNSESVPVWFATNRKTTELGGYSAIREPSKNSYGRIDVEVSVAQNHTPSKKNLAMVQVVKMNEDAFFEEINDRLDMFRKLKCKPQVLVVLHSYKVGFADSLINASHWNEDVNVAGATISYSWPSIGIKGSYEPDDAALERSEPEILDFLLKVSAICGAANVHLLSDGTSCQGLIRVLQRMAADRIDIKFGQMFLIVPDVDSETFTDLAWLFPKYTTRTTIYASNCDKTAAKSVKRHHAPRAGFFKPFTIVDGVDTVAIAGLETDDLLVEKRTRSYEVLTLLYDMYDLMKSNAPPSRRLHLTKQTADGKPYWKLRKL